jgi:glucosamine-6-phosphate isomerase
MNVQTFPDYAALSAHAANHIAEVVRQKPDAMLCLASGDTPTGTYRLLADMALAKQVDLSRCRFIGLDEWVGFGPDDAGSCGYYLYRDLFTPAAIRPDQITYFDAKATDLQAECRRVDAIIDGNGGLDLLLVGIGMNGHIALNEPGTSFRNRCHVAELAETTKAVGQKYFAQQTTLTQGITLGLQHLLEAHEVILMASGAKKAVIMQQALYGPVTEQCPASVVQTHGNAFVWVDADVMGRVHESTIV